AGGPSPNSFLMPSLQGAEEGVTEACQVAAPKISRLAELAGAPTPNSCGTHGLTAGGGNTPEPDSDFGFRNRGTAKLANPLISDARELVEPESGGSASSSARLAELREACTARAPAIHGWAADEPDGDSGTPPAPQSLPR